MKKELNNDILERVRLIMAPVPKKEDGKFDRETFGKIYDDVCESLVQLGTEQPDIDIVDYTWEIGSEKGYEYSPDIFSSIGEASDSK